MDIVLRRTDSSDKEFKELIRHLDLELAERYGERQAFFDQFNSVDEIRNVMIAMQGAQAVGCGAFKKYDRDVCEIKRMFVLKGSRGNNIGRKILAALETWAAEEGFARCILETGNNQPEAIRLYENTGYVLIPNYGQYTGVDISLCMEKKLRDVVDNQSK
jgi:GNAT superfamily N-acetyltransferase